MSDGYRWAQLAYASIPADASGDAGWRVKETTGDPSDAERELLLARAVTRFESHIPFPPLGQESSVYEGLPRKFGYAPADGGRAVYWHAAQVDKDGFGRTGNVFSHLILDRTVDDPEPLRPIGLWRSPDLAAPHWYSAIAATRLPASAPRAGAVTTVDAALDFLFDPSQWRTGTLAVLMDAVFAAIAGGPAVVLRCDDQDEAALWVAALSYTMSPRDARRLSFSLYERGVSDHGAAALAAVQGGAHLVVVPRSDELDPAGIVVIDPLDAITPGEPGGRHTASLGTSAPVSNASQLALLSLFSREDGARLFAAVDEVSARVGGVATTDPAWPLAMSLILAEADYPDAAEAAAEVVKTSTPARVADNPELRTAVERVVGRVLGGDPRSVWEALATLQPSSYTYEMLAIAYLTAAVRDRAWLTASRPAPVPEAATLAHLESLHTAFVGELDAAIGGADGSDAMTVWRLRLLDFETRAVPKEARDERVVVRAEEVAHLVVDTLTDATTAGAVAQCLETLAPATLERYLTPALRDLVDDRLRSQGPQPLTVRLLPDSLLIALYSTGLPPIDAPAGPLDEEFLLVSGRGSDPATAALLTREYLTRYRDWNSIPRDGREVALKAVSRWSPAQLLEILGGAQAQLPADLLQAVLLRSRSDEGIGQLHACVAASYPDGSPLVQLAMLRLFASFVTEPEDPATAEPWGAPQETYLLGGMLAQLADPEKAGSVLRESFAAAIVAFAVALRAGAQRPPAFGGLRDDILADELSAAARDRAALAAAESYLTTRSRRADDGRSFSVGLAALAIAARMSDDRQGPDARVLRAIAGIAAAGDERMIDQVAAAAIAHWSASAPISQDEVWGFAQRSALVSDASALERETGRWWKRFGSGEDAGFFDRFRVRSRGEQ